MTNLQNITPISTASKKFNSTIRAHLIVKLVLVQTEHAQLFYFIDKTRVSNQFMEAHLLIFYNATTPAIETLCYTMLLQIILHYSDD